MIANLVGYLQEKMDIFTPDKSIFLSALESDFSELKRNWALRIWGILKCRQEFWFLKAAEYYQ